MKKYFLAALLSVAIAAPSIAQTAPVKTEQATPPATLDDVVYSQQRINKLVAALSVDVAAIRAAENAPRKSALYVDSSSFPLSIVGSDTAAVLANKWCASIHYASAKVVWANGDKLMTFVCFD